MKRNVKAFTLLEALVAGVIIGAAVVGVGAVSNRCLSQTQLSRDHENAWQLLDRQLTLIDYMGLDAFLEQGITRGEVDGLGPTFYWHVLVTPQGIDDLHLVRVTIQWETPTGNHKVSAATMLNSPTGLAFGAYQPEDRSASEAAEND